MIPGSGMEGKRKGRLQQVVCYRDGDKTGGLQLEERRESGRFLGQRYSLKCLNEEKT